MAEAQSAIGKPFSPAVQTALLRGRSARKLRLIRPGMVIAQDFEPDRLNLILDKDGSIVTVRCG